jgi:hypothetical protein
VSFVPGERDLDFRWYGTGWAQSQSGRCGLGEALRPCRKKDPSRPAHSQFLYRPSHCNSYGCRTNHTFAFVILSSLGFSHKSVRVKGTALGFPTKILHIFLISSMLATCPTYLTSQIHIHRPTDFVIGINAANGIG